MNCFWSIKDEYSQPIAHVVSIYIDLACQSQKSSLKVKDSGQTPCMIVTHCISETAISRWAQVVLEEKKPGTE